MLSINTRLLFVVFLLTSVATFPVLAQGDFIQIDTNNEFINANDVVTMNRGYPIQIEGVGEVLIKSVQNSHARFDDGSQKPLLVNKTDLGKRIIKHFQSVKEGRYDGRAATDLATLNHNEGDIVICYPQGPAAPICYIISCDYDPDSAVLPCF